MYKDVTPEEAYDAIAAVAKIRWVHNKDVTEEAPFYQMYEMEITMNNKMLRKRWEGYLYVAPWLLDLQFWLWFHSSAWFTFLLQSIICSACRKWVGIKIT